MHLFPPAQGTLINSVSARLRPELPLILPQNAEMPAQLQPRGHFIPLCDSLSLQFICDGHGCVDLHHPRLNVHA